MLAVKVVSGAAEKMMSLAEFLGAGVCPTAMFVEEAIMRFNKAHEGEVAALVKVAPVLH